MQCNAMYHTVLYYNKKETDYLKCYTNHEAEMPKFSEGTQCPPSNLFSI